MSEPKDSSALARLEAPLAQLERLPPGPVRDAAASALRAVLDLHGEALARVLELARAQPGADAILHALADDANVSQVLLLHGLHPLDLEARLGKALGAIDAYLKLHLARVELVAVSDAAVKVRLSYAAVGCGSTGAKVRARVEEAIGEAAPEVAVQLEEATGMPEAGAGFVALSRLSQSAAQKEKTA